MGNVRTSVALRSAGLGLALTILASCGGGDSSPPLPASEPAPAPTPSTQPPPGAALRVVPAVMSLDRDGKGQLLPMGASGAVQWSSSDPGIVVVDAQGAVHAIARGSVTISATANGSSAQATVRVFDTQASPPDASSDALIAQAVQAGRLGADDALLQRLYASFGDARLGDEFAGAPSRESVTALLREASGRLPTLSADLRALVRPFLLPPIYAESWYAQQLGLTASAQARPQRQARALADSDSCTLIGLGVRRAATAHFNVWTVDFGFNAFRADALPPAELASLVASHLEQVYASETRLLNRFPLSDVAEDCNGGDGAIDVYLTPLMGNEDFGQTVPYPGRCEQVPAFIKLNMMRLANDTAPSLQGAPAAQRFWKSVVAHETLHTIQFAMDRAAACGDYEWSDEGTAQWIIDYVDESNDFEDGFAKVAGAARSGKFYVDYLKGGHRSSLEKANGYTTYIFFQFLARKYGSRVIKHLFDAWTVNDSVAALEVALAAVGTDMKTAWPEFAKVLWNDYRNNVLGELNAWDRYDFGMSNVTTARPVALGGSGKASMTLLRDNVVFPSGYEIAPRSIAYERLVFQDDSVSAVMLANPLPQTPNLKLYAVKKIGGQWRAPEDWSDKPTKFHCRDKQDERLQELVLIVSNGDGDPNAAPVALRDDLPLEVSVSNVGCWKWQGQATIQTISDDGVNNGELTSRATDLVFEPPADFEGGPMTLSVTGGMANGLAISNSVLPIVCHITITGPATTIQTGDVGIVWFNMDLKHPVLPTADRKVLLLNGVKFIDSTQVATCDGNTTVTPAPSTGWIWLLFPLSMHPLEVSSDGRRIEANVTFTELNTRTVHNFSFTAMRE